MLFGQQIAHKRLQWLERMRGREIDLVPLELHKVGLLYREVGEMLEILGIDIRAGEDMGARGNIFELRDDAVPALEGIWLDGEVAEDGSCLGECKAEEVVVLDVLEEERGRRVWVEILPRDGRARVIAGIPVFRHRFNDILDSVMVVEHGDAPRSRHERIHDVLRICEVYEIEMCAREAIGRRGIAVQGNIFRGVAELLPGGVRSAEPVGAAAVVEDYRAFHI